MYGKLPSKTRSGQASKTQGVLGTDRRLEGEGLRLNLTSGVSTERDDGLHILWEDGDRVFCREWRPGADGNRSAVLAMRPVAEHPSPVILHRLAHEYGLKDELDGAWAVRPLDLIDEGGRTVLFLEDPGGEPLSRLIGEPIEVGSFLASRHQYGCGSRQAPPARPHPQGHEALQHPGELR